MKPQTENPEFDNVDPLQEAYRETIANIPERIASLRNQNAALLCIDMQYLDAAEGYGVFADATSSGVPLEAQEYYFTTLAQYVLPNVRRLQECFRANDLEVIHTRIQSLTMDGRDRSPGHKRLGLHAAPGSKEAEFLPEVAPSGDELVINKTASGVFTSTNLEFILRNMGIDALFVTGVYSNECVSTTVRDASDLGFLVTVIDDACTTVTRELHDFTIAGLRDRYARILSTDETIGEISSELGAQTQAAGPNQMITD